MTFKFYLIIITTGIYSNSFSQQISPSIIAAAGEVSAIGNISLEWTLGEVATESIKSDQALYTQGYHQPELIVEKIKSITENANTEKISIFPNPASSVINIQLGFTLKTALSVTLLDMRGRLLLKKEIPSNNKSLQLNVSPFAKGTYLLKINNSNASISQSYKVIKGL